MSAISLGAVVVEFLALKASGRLAPSHTVPGRNGQVEFCGSDELGSLTVVAPGGNALLVLGLGTREGTVGIFEAIAPEGLFWDARPNRVVLGGIERTFRPLGGQLVIGVLESGDLSVILCQFDGLVGIVTYEGGLPTLAFVSAQGTAFGVVDIDTHRLLTSRARSSRHHFAAPCDSELSELIARALHDLATRASMIERPKAAKPSEPQVWGTKRVGKRDVGGFADLMIGLGARGCGDLSGTSGGICGQINTYYPGSVVVTPKKLSQVLGLVLRTGTCLVARPTYREWLILIGELRRPGSQLLRRFLAECPQASALSLPSSGSVEGVVSRPRTNGLVGAAPPPPPNAPNERPAAAAHPPSPNNPAAGRPAAAARPPPPNGVSDDLLAKLAAALPPATKQ